ncbi:MAG: hypothetical protein AB1634_00120 [Thermodesulfobacteriota bacterium]
MKAFWFPLPLVVLLGLACLLPPVAAGADYQRLGRLVVAMPTALAVDGDENLYVVEADPGRLTVYGRDGSRLRVLSGLARPSSVAVAPDGSILVGASGTESVTVYSPELAPQRQLGQGAGEVKRPLAIAVAASGRIFVADALAGRILVYAPGGSRLLVFGSPGSGDGQLSYPTAITIDEARQEIIVADLPLVSSPMGNHQGARLQVFDNQGRFLRRLGSFGVGTGQLVKPVGLAMAGDGDLLVVDAYQNVVQLFDALGMGQGAVFDPALPLATPLDIGVGPRSGRLFVADAEGVQVFGLPGSVHTVTATAVGGGSLMPAGAITVLDGDDQPFLLTADEGHAIASLELDGVPVAGVTGLAASCYTLPAVRADHALTATFAPRLYQVAAVALGHGRLSPAGVLPVAHGGELNFTISPDPGYKVAALLVDGVDQGPVSSYRLADIVADHSVEATFVPLSTVVIRASAGDHGRITPAGTVSVTEGGDQAFAIVADPGYAIADVVVDGVSQGARDRYLFADLREDHVIEASFLATVVWQELTVSVEGEGTVASQLWGIDCPTDCVAEFAQGSAVALTASPAAGQLFAGWSGDCTGGAPTCVLTMTGRRAAGAHFLPALRSETFESGDWRTFPWLTGGAAPWLLQEQGPHRGRYAAQAPTGLEPHAMAYLEVRLQMLEPGPLSFWLRMTDATGSDQLRLLVDGVEKGAWSGDQDWRQAQIALAAGSHLCRWEYRRAGGAETASAWLDDIVFPVLAPLPAPLPDLKANDSDGPLVLRRGEPLRLSYGLAAGEALGQGSDWVLALRSPWGWFFYDQARQLWSQRAAFSYQGPLTDRHAHTPLLQTTGLPPGGYVFYFLVDTTMNSRMDEDLVLDTVVVKVGK